MLPTDRRAGLLVMAVFLLIAFEDDAAADPPPASTTLTADQAAALDRITADSLQGHLSFLASDLLEGRDTPSRGLDLAAEYIAAQFRRAGLEAIGDDGYFQTANWKLLETDADGFAFEVKNGDGPPIRVGKELVSLQRLRGFRRGGRRVFKIDARDAEEPASRSRPRRSKARRSLPKFRVSARETGPRPGRSRRSWLGWRRSRPRSW